ncbi:transglutaminase-like domain-containing protein [Nocardioides litoris]|uniref:transglutaminase-like domain-containing protein n=1 Tax=Nocardioides litoris TaxID=1926648 RepID=UPI0011237BAA|nr:transglutaminase-like domain-containing protein [Nocardioides litoris]
MTGPAVPPPPPGTPSRSRRSRRRTSARAGRATTTRRPVATAGPGWRPTPAALVDAGFVLVLALLALLGLRTTFTGATPLLVGLGAVAVALLLVGLVRALRWPGIAAVTLALPTWLLGGCLVAVAGPGAVAEQVVGGWKELLTTLPPVDGSGAVLVLPWTLGLATGLLAGLARDLRSGPPWLRSGAVLVAPVALLAVVVLLGVSRPQSLWLQGCAFAVVAVGSVAVREARRDRPVEGHDAGRLRRAVGATALVGVAGALAVPLTGVASADDAGRVFLREEVLPPFDVGQYPSPLASFRRYVEEPDEPGVQTSPQNLWDTTLLTVQGAPAGTRLRIAALDSYDGIVWGAAEDTDPTTTDDAFQRVSTTIDNPAPGRRVEARVTLGEGYRGVWLPTVGALQGLDFDTGDPEVKRQSWRYNLASATAVVPTGVGPGDTYHFTAVLPTDGADVVRETDVPSGSVNDNVFAASFLDTQAVQWSAGASAPMERVLAIAEHLKVEGKYSDGVLEAERIYHPGHHQKRLGEEFAAAPIPVGNDEQYAAIMALLATKVGVPARVVMGAVLPADGVVRGKDVSAWVELQLADGSWRTLPTEAFMDDDRPAEQPPVAEQEMSGTVVPPPAPIPPPSTLADQNDAELEARKVARDDSDDGGGLPGWVRWVVLGVGGPLLLAALVVGTILGLKAWRRRRRRQAERASARVVGGWRELVDHARDQGQPVPVGAGLTRRQQAPHVATPAAVDLARHADGLVFGPAEPDDEVADRFWALVDAERRTMSRSLTRPARVRAALNLRSFRRR